MRRALFPEHPLGFVEPPTGTDRSILWPYVQAAAAVHGGDIALVLRALDYTPDDPVPAARAARAASLVSVDVAGSTIPGALTGSPATTRTGWSRPRSRRSNASVTGAGGPSPGIPQPESRLRGRDAATERTESFDPFAVDARGARLTVRRRPRRA